MIYYILYLYIFDVWFYSLILLIGHYHFFKIFKRFCFKFITFFRIFDFDSKIFLSLSSKSKFENKSLYFARLNIWTIKDINSALIKLSTFQHFLVIALEILYNSYFLQPLTNSKLSGNILYNIFQIESSKFQKC